MIVLDLVLATFLHESTLKTPIKETAEKHLLAEFWSIRHHIHKNHYGNAQELFQPVTENHRFFYAKFIFVRSFSLATTAQTSLLNMVITSKTCKIELPKLLQIAAIMFQQLI